MSSKAQRGAPEFAGDQLERMGYQIRHESRDGERYVTFVLAGEPAEPKPIPSYQRRGEGDWFEKATGKPRPATQQPDLGPLFPSSTDGN